MSRVNETGIDKPGITEACNNYNELRDHFCITMAIGIVRWISLISTLNNRIYNVLISIVMITFLIVILLFGSIDM